MLKRLFERKSKQEINNYTCWYKMLEIFLMLFVYYIKEHVYNFDKLKESINTLNTLLNNNNLEKLLKKYNPDKNHIIFKKLHEYNHCNNLPFFELFLINLLKNNNLSVIDLFCLDGNNYYPNLHNYYTYDNNLNFNNNIRLLNNKFYKLYLNDINKYFSTSNEKLDVLIVSHYNYNEQLTTYFNSLKSNLLQKYNQYKLISKNNFDFKNNKITEIRFILPSQFINKNFKFKMIACILRNSNNDRQQKNILGIIYNFKQFIIDDTKDNIFVEFNWIINNKFNNETYTINDDNSNEYNYNFATGDKLFIYINNNNKCTNLDVIPQFLGTCWFNAILMASLYSQGSRNILFQKIKNNNWGNKDSFQKVLKSILIQSHNPDKTKIQKLYKKIKPENILLKMISKYDNDLKEELKEKIQKKNSIGWTFVYIVKYLKHIGMKCLDIYYYKGAFFGNFYNYTKIIFDDNDIYYIKNTNFDSKKNNEELTELLKDKGPDYLILFHNDLNKFVEEIYFEQWYDYMKENIHTINFNIDDYIKDDEKDDIINYKDIIYFNGNKYKLDSCLLSNYNKKEVGHAIVGLTCNNKRYVYNGWNQNNTTISPCSLMPYDWDLNKQEGFCLNKKKCKLDFHNLEDKKEDLCYSFNKGDRILIYTKIVEENNEKIDFSESSKTNSLSHMSSIIGDIYDLKDYSKEEIINYLIKNHKYKEDDLKEDNINDLKKILRYELKKHYNVKNISSSPKGIEISLNPISIQIEQ